VLKARGGVAEQLFAGEVVWNPQRETGTMRRHHEVSAAHSGLAHIGCVDPGRHSRARFTIVFRAFGPFGLSLVTSAATAAIRAGRSSVSEVEEFSTPHPGPAPQRNAFSLQPSPDLRPPSPTPVGEVPRSRRSGRPK